MNIVEKEAMRYSRDVNIHHNNLSVIKNKLSDKLYNFNRDKDKLDFLSVLKKCFEEQYISHELKCTNKINCPTAEGLQMLIFAVQQEYDDIEQYYAPEIPSNDTFSTEEQINIHNKINEILENLTEIKVGQEVIFNEFDELRQHFKLGKKNWFQLLRSKLVDVVAVTIIEKSVAENIYSTLAKEVSNVSTFIESQL